MAAKLRVLSGQIPGRKGREPECIGEPGTHPTCPAGSRGPKGPGLKVGVGWGGVVQASCQHSHLFPGATVGKSTSRLLSQGLPSVGRRTAPLSRAPPTPPPHPHPPAPCFPQLRQTTQQGSFVWGHFGLGTQGEGLTEEPLAFGHFGCPIWNTL